MHCSFARIHQTVGTSPAQAAGVTETLWSIRDIARGVETVPRRASARRISASKSGMRTAPVEQVAVHVREPRKLLVELRLPPVGRRVKHLERALQPRNQLGPLDVDRVLIAERPALYADDELELLDVLRQVGEREAGLLAFVPVEKLECLKVAEKLEAGALPFRQRVEVRAGQLTCGQSSRVQRSCARPAGRRARTDR